MTGDRVCNSQPARRPFTAKKGFESPWAGVAPSMAKRDPYHLTATLASARLGAIWPASPSSRRSNLLCPRFTAAGLFSTSAGIQLLSRRADVRLRGFFGFAWPWRYRPAYVRTLHAASVVDFGFNVRLRGICRLFSVSFETVPSDAVSNETALF